MRPRTKQEKEVVKLSRGLPSLTEKMAHEAAKQATKPIGIKDSKGNGICLECGHSWKCDKDDKAICPKCGSRLNLESTRQRVFKDELYFANIIKCHGYQVIRVAYCKVKRQRGKSIGCGFYEVMQRWISPNGKETILSLSRGQNYYCDAWNCCSEMSVKIEGYHHRIMPSAIVGRSSYIPELKRNGFDGKLHGANPHYLFIALLKDNAVESVWKMKQYPMATYMMVNSSARQYLASIKVANRHKYLIDDPSLWIDTVSSLHYLEKDIRNPKFICPQNLRETHDYWVQKCQEHRAKLARATEAEQLKGVCKEWNPKYIEAKSKFFDIKILDDELCISPLKSVEDFYQEGTTMHHCVYANKYYAKNNCLILRAEIDGVSVATIELNTDNMTVIQCRGKCNAVPPHKDRILSLIESNKSLIASKAAS